MHDKSAGVIAIANYDLSATGTVGQSIEIARALVAAGVPAELWVVRASGDFAARVPVGVPVLALANGSLIRAKKQYDALLHSVDLARLIARRKPAVVLSGGKHLHLTTRLGLMMSGGSNQTSFAGRASNSALRHGRRGMALLLAQLATKFKYEAMDEVIAVAPAIADELAPLLPKGRERLCVIPNGVDTARVEQLAAAGTPHPWALDVDRPLIVSSGRIHDQKGFDLLVRAMGRLPPRCPARLLLIGGGDPAPLSKLAQAEGVGDRVACSGFLDNPFPTIARADLFVLASRWEGASNALIEALALGLPLVATDVGGSRDVLSAGRNGRLVPPEDVGALAAAIDAELASPRDRSEQRLAARRFCSTVSLASYVDRLSVLRRRALARRGEASARDCRHR